MPVQPLPTDYKLGDRGHVAVRERERYMPLLGWDKEYLFWTDGSAWCDDKGDEKREPKHLRPPRGFVWVEGVDWQVEVKEGLTDADGWRYGWNVTETKWAPRAELQHVVRFRTWKRECVFDPVAFLGGTEGAPQGEDGRRVAYPIHRSIEMWENERWVVFAGFSSNHLLPTDPPRFQSTKEPYGAAEREPQLEKGWAWGSEWKIKLGGYPCDDNGWEYSWNYRPAKWSGKCSSSDFVRRRLWSRDVVFNPPSDLIEDKETLPAESRRNLELITSSVLAEIAAGETQIGNGSERDSLIATVNDTLKALNVEENLTVTDVIFLFCFVLTPFKAEAASNALQFLAATNKAQKDRVLVCAEAPKLQQWLDGWRGRPPMLPLEELKCSDLDIAKRCKELDFRAANFLQAREQLLPVVERALLPGRAQWAPIVSKREEPAPHEEEEAEL